MSNLLFITQSSPEGENQNLVSRFIEVIGEDSYDGIITVKNADEVSGYDIETHSQIIMVVPEWNGSFPYTFKKLIDESGRLSLFKNSEIILIGTSNSPFGNIMGVEHLAYILRWCGANVLSPIFYHNLNEPEDSDRFIDMCHYVIDLLEPLTI